MYILPTTLLCRKLTATAYGPYAVYRIHTQPPIQWLPGLSRGYSGWVVALTTHPI